MLIYSDKYRGWGKQKPKQWGPLSAVRSAVFHNAERMGLDPSRITGFYSLWDTANLVGPFITTTYSNRITLGGNAAITSKGLKTSSGYANLNAYAGEVWKVSGQISLLCTVTPDSVGGTDRSIYSRWGTSSFEHQIKTWVDADGGGVGYAAAIYDGSDYKKIGTDNSDAVAGAAANIVVTYKGSDFFSIYVNGVLTGSIATNSGIYTVSGTLPFALGSDGSDALTRNYFDGTIHLAGSYDGVLSADQISQLHETPYALLQPVPLAYFFDMAGGSTGTPISAYYDLSARASNQYIFAYDQRVAVSTARASSADSILKASTALDQNFDSTARISNDLNYNADSRAGISNTATYSTDTNVAIGTLQSIVADFDTLTRVSKALAVDTDTRLMVSNSLLVSSNLQAEISNKRTSTHDLRCQVSNELLREVDSRLSLSNELISNYDTQAITGNQVTVVENFDTLINVRNAITMAINSKVGVSNEIKNSTNTKTGVSSLLDIIADSRVKASNNIAHLTDTQIAVSQIASLVQVFDTKASVSTDISKITDTLINIYDVIISALSNLAIVRDPVVARFERQRPVVSIYRQTPIKSIQR